MQLTSMEPRYKTKMKALFYQYRNDLDSPVIFAEFFPIVVALRNDMDQAQVNRSQPLF